MPPAGARDQRPAAGDVVGDAEARLEVVVVVAAVGADEVLEAGVLRILQRLSVDVVHPQVGVEVVAQAEIDA